MPALAWLIVAITIITALFAWLVVAMWRAENRDAAKRQREFDAVKAAFDSLPTPKNEIPSTLKKVTY